MLRLLIAVLLLATSGFAGSAPQPSPDPSPTKPAALPPMTGETRVLVIRSLNAEMVYVRHALPKGEKGVTLRDKKIISPDEGELARQIATYGAAAKPGDQALITNIVFKENRIVLEINGGPRKKTKWYQRVQVGIGPGAMVQAPDQHTNNPHGSVVELLFDTKYVPDLTGDQIRDLLYPVLDFKAQSPAEAYLESVPPKVKAAIQNHLILVGMDREMVEYAKGRPDRKLRDRDADGKEYEEWLYGAPPQEVQFVRFRGDEVVRFEIMRVNGEKIVRTEKEVDAKPVVAENQEQPAVQQSSKKPSLRRPGEEQETPNSLDRGGADDGQKEPPRVPDNNPSN